MSKKITFSIPDYLYDGLKNSFLLPKDISLNDLFKACAINRMIDKNYLDEFGQPIEMPTLSLPDWSELNTCSKTGFDLNELRSVTNAKM